MQTVNKICICGGGSLAHVLAAVLGRQKQISVCLLTRKPTLWKKEVEINYRGIGVLRGNLDIISDKPERAVAGADLVLITVPSFAYVEIWNTIKSFISEDAILGALPGNGGFEWIANSHKGTVFGMQRIPYVCRVEEYGSSVFVNGVREKVYIATNPSKEAAIITEMLQPLLQLNIFPLPNYLNIGLAPANSIFHSVRNYSLFLKSKKTNRYSKPTMFYECWDDLASSLFLQCDEEIQNLCRNLPIDLSGVSSIRTHYHADNIVDLSKVIRNIESLKGIPAPMINHGKYWSMDYSHRFFSEDMLIGLQIFLYFSKIVGVNMPVINNLFEWSNTICRANGIYNAYDVSSLARKVGISSTKSISQYYEL